MEGYDKMPERAISMAVEYTGIRGSGPVNLLLWILPSTIGAGKQNPLRYGLAI
jgi:hypothetical protein